MFKRILKTKDEAEKKILLKLEDMLSFESAAIKEVLDVLLTDPCPLTEKGFSHSRVCSKCEHEENCIKLGVITGKCDL